MFKKDWKNHMRAKKTLSRIRREVVFVPEKDRKASLKNLSSVKVDTIKEE